MERVCETQTKMYIIFKTKVIENVSLRGRAAGI